MLDLHAEPLRHAGDRPFQAGVIKGHKPAAVLADEVVMVVLAPRKGPLEPRHAWADRDTLDQPMLAEQFEGPVNRGQANPPALGLQGRLYLDGAQGTRFGGQQLDHALPRFCLP
jgi:hypothetical protein